MRTHGATACLQSEFLLTLPMLHGSIRTISRHTEFSGEMNHYTYIQTPTGCQSAPAPRFALAADRWVVKRALSGRRTD